MRLYHNISTIMFICLMNAMGSNATAASLDGVAVEAVDNYPEPRPSEIDLGLGLLPLNPYYNGVSVGLGFTRHLSRNWAWQILSANYVFPFQTGLTSELADTYFVNPESIEKLQYTLSTNISYTLAYGKILLFDDYIRSFRASVFVGPSFISTSSKTSYGANFGLKWETFVKPSYAWFISATDLVRIKKPLRNDVQFAIGSCIGF